MIYLSDLLIKEDVATDTFGKVPFGGQPFTADGDEVKYNSDIDEDIYVLLYQYVQDSSADGYQLNDLYKYKRYFQLGKLHYPQIFNPTYRNKQLKYVYRGLARISDKLINQIEHTKPEQWIKIRCSQQLDMWLYTGGNVTYTPHKPIQSFSTDLKTAEVFASEALLVSKVTGDYFMNPIFMNDIARLTLDTNEGEYETLRFSNAPESVNLLIADSVYVAAILKRKDMQPTNDKPVTTLRNIGKYLQ